ncbi:MAG: hypothetical protein IJV41_12795 [Oscillospiraceae bacterium]|nr:hypothetical protein [Oscillospiraceae bacterium]
MKDKRKLALVCGLLGCLCYGGGDWLMMYGDPTHAGSLIWLTTGTAQIPLWRYDLALALAFPGIILYGIALFAVETYILADKERKVYHYLNAFGLTPWIALHLFYIMILVLFAWLNANGFAADALTICEGLFHSLSWLVPISEALMLPVFLYWFYLQITGKTAFPKAMAFTNVLILFALLKLVSGLLPVSAFRLGFTNGLMSESMILWFGILLIWETKENL